MNGAVQFIREIQKAEGNSRGTMRGTVRALCSKSKLCAVQPGESGGTRRHSTQAVRRRGLGAVWLTKGENNKEDGLLCKSAT
jgi:predicted transcriptional regulator